MLVMDRNQESREAWQDGLGGGGPRDDPRLGAQRGQDVCAEAPGLPRRQRPGRGQQLITVGTA